MVLYNQMFILKCMMKCLSPESEYGTYTKRQDVNYLFAAYTKEDGTYQGKLELPSYLTRYISILPLSLHKL